MRRNRHNGKRQAAKGKRAALYFRESDDRRQENSLERQRRTVPEYAEEQGYSIVAEFTDDGLAGDTFKSRKGLQALLKSASEGQFDVVVVDQLSRIARMRTVDFMRYVAGPLEDYHVELDTAQNNLQGWDDVVDIIQLAVKQNKDLDEVCDLSYRVANGMLTNALKGEWQGGKVYGFKTAYYTNAEGKLKHRLVIDEAAACIVRQIYEWYLSGKHSVRGIARMLTARKVPSPRSNGKITAGWEGTTVHRILANKIYVGTLSWNRASRGKYHRLVRGKAVPHDKPRGEDDRSAIRNDKDSHTSKADAHDAIIDKATWDAVQKMLAQRKRSGHKSPSPQNYLLSGLLRCGVCNHRLCGNTLWTTKRLTCPECGHKRVVTLQPGKTEERCKCGHVYTIPEGQSGQAVYQCQGWRMKGKETCRCRTVDEVDLLHCIGADLEELIGEPDKRREEILASLTDSARNDPIKLAERKQALAMMETKIKTAVERALTMPPELAGDVVAALEAMRAERTRLETEVRELSEAISSTADVRAVADAVVNHLRIIRLHLVSGDRTTVRTILQQFVEQVTVEFDKQADNASVILGFRMKYRDDAFTIRSLLASCASLVAAHQEAWESQVAEAQASVVADG